MNLVQKLAERIFRRIHQMVGLIFAVIMRIIALTATGATARVVLHKEIPTTGFVRNWHKHSTELWTEQNKIDNEIVNELADLRQAGILLRDQLELSKEQIKLKCDWNVIVLLL